MRASARVGALFGPDAEPIFGFDPGGASLTVFFGARMSSAGCPGAGTGREKRPLQALSPAHRRGGGRHAARSRCGGGHREAPAAAVVMTSNLAA